MVSVTTLDSGSPARTGDALPPLIARPGIAAIGEHVRLGALRTPERTAFAIHRGPRRSYAELHERTNRMATALLDAGIVPGTRVAIWLGNCLEYLDTYLACAKAGLVVVQLNIRHTAYEVAHQLADSGAVVLVFGDETADRVGQLDGRDNFRLRVTTGVAPAGAVTMAELLARGRDEMPPPPADDDLLVIGYTSGTTGFPKGALLTHRSVGTLGQTNAIVNRYPMAGTMIFGMSLSFTATIPSHVLTHLYVGGTTVILTEWDTATLVDAIEEHRGTFTILPTPAIPDFCAIVERDPGRVQTLVSVLHSASKAPPEYLDRLVAAIGPRLVEGWGMTENSGGLLTATSASDYTDPDRDIYSSAGRAAPDVVLRLVDELERPLPHDGVAVGQIVAHSASLAVGYWNNPAATAATFRDGWYFTGDLGRIDPDGYVYIMDRRPDLIVRGGMNIYPSELERVILGHPGVREVAVVAEDHPRWGQTPVAWVVGDPELVTAESILDRCREQLAGYKRPDRVVVVDELPRNASGKVVRHLLRGRRS